MRTISEIITTVVFIHKYTIISLNSFIEPQTTSNFKEFCQINAEKLCTYEFNETLYPENTWKCILRDTFSINCDPLVFGFGWTSSLLNILAKG